MPMTDKQKKYAYIAAAVIAVYYLAPWAINTARYMMFAPAKPAYRKPSAAVPMPPPPPKPAIVIVGIDPADTAKLTQFSRLIGNWRATAMTPNVGLCTLALQMTLGKDQPGYYTAYSTRTCNISLALMGKPISNEEKSKDFQNAMTPVSAILTGSVTGGDIHLAPKENIGKPALGCAFSGLIVTPFATDELAVQWQADPCPGGQIILRRVNGTL